MRIKISVFVAFLLAFATYMQKPDLFMEIPAKHPFSSKLFTKNPLLPQQKKLLQSSSAYLELSAGQSNASAAPIVYDVTEKVYQTTVEYIGPSVSDYAKAVDKEIAKINGSITDAANTINVSMHNETVAIGKTFQAILENYTSNVVNATEKLITKVDEESERISHSFDELEENTEKSYDTLTKQADVNLEQTIAIEKLLLVEALSQEETLYDHLQDEIASLRLQAAPGATSSNSTCSKSITCVSCVRDANCGWCVFENACVRGDSIGPTFAMCTFYEYNVCSVPPSNEYTTAPPIIEPNSTNGILNEIEELVEESEAVNRRITDLEIEIAELNTTSAAISSEVAALGEQIAEENGETSGIGDQEITERGAVLNDAETSTGSNASTLLEFSSFLTVSYPVTQKTDLETTGRKIFQQK